MPVQAPAIPHPSVAPPQITGTTNEVMAQALLYQHALVSNYGYGAANAAQVAEANRYKLDVEREVHPDVNIPEGAPAWAQAIVTGIAALNTRLDTMDGSLTALRHSTSQMRMLALANNQAATSTTILSPVPHETTGIMPPDTFPRTLEELNGLTASEVTGLLTFYDCTLQGGVDAKRKRLRQAIGVRTEL